MNQSLKRDRGVKIITLGNKEVGKSCIVRRYCEKRFISKYVATIGIDYGIVRAVVNDEHLRVNIFDLSGNPLFYEVRKEFYDGINGVLLIYDTGNRCSFDSLNSWLNELKKHLIDTAAWDSTVIVVCGNKRDKKREVDESEGHLWANLHGFLFFETSAQTGDGIQAMFQALFGNILKVLEGDPQPPVLRSQFGVAKERLDVIRRLRWAKNDYEKLGLLPGASREEINKAYRKLAILLHPDKSNVPGSEEAFKTLGATRLALLRHLSY